MGHTNTVLNKTKSGSKRSGELAVKGLKREVRAFTNPVILTIVAALAWMAIPFSGGLSAVVALPVSLILAGKLDELGVVG